MGRIVVKQLLIDIFPSSKSMYLIKVIFLCKIILLFLSDGCFTSGRHQMNNQLENKLVSVFMPEYLEKPSLCFALKLFCLILHTKSSQEQLCLLL